MRLHHVRGWRLAEPDMAQGFPGAHAVIRPLFQHLGDNVLRIFRNPIPDSAVEGRTFCCLYHLEEQLDICRHERRIPSQQLIGHATDAPDITLRPILSVAGCNLGCHANRRATIALVDASGFFQTHRFVWPVALKVELNCKTKICYLNIRVWIVGHHKDILRFQVSVHYTIGVHVMHCLEDLLDDARSVLLREMPEGHDALVDVAPVCIFHDQPHLCTRVHHLHQIHDVPMLQLPQAPYLSLEGHVTG
mmetsp:Transcript_71736/g.124440  ORF Transcript_71736/g.124440 Transcript_71736/m.124440 type:complete len:248 (+) Transcript_71736:593-1336(+)